MNKLIFCCLLAMVFFLACNNGPKPVEIITKDGTKAQSFGEKITMQGAVAYDDLLSKMDSQDSLAIKVKGNVSAVCQAKGCWMNIVSQQPNQPEMFVKFKDYGFFMPKDIAGRDVILEGYAFREVTSIEELKHYAEDEGKSKEEIDAITEPVEELKFMASGVLLLEKS